MIPAAVCVMLTLGALTQIGTETPYWLSLGVHIVMMVSLGLLFTPVFTLGLGDVPIRLYTHGSSMLGTIQQVAGAFGTALVITLTTSYAEDRVTAGVNPLEGTVEGMRLAFLVSAALSVVVVLLAVLLPNRPADDPQAAPATTSDPPTAPAGGEDLDAGAGPHRRGGGRGVGRSKGLTTPSAGAYSSDCCGLWRTAGPFTHLMRKMHAITR